MSNELLVEVPEVPPVNPERSAKTEHSRPTLARRRGGPLRLGELIVWSELAPFATLVAVIRGHPPEDLHETFRNVLARIHAERPEALEKFNGDSSGFADVEAALTDWDFPAYWAGEISMPLKDVLRSESLLIMRD